MKQEKDQITITGLHYKELEEKLNQLGTEGKNLAIEQAKDNASLNLPKIDSKPKAFFGGITTFFAKGIGFIRTALSSSLAQFNEAEEKQEFETQKEIIQKDAVEVTNVLRLKKREKQKLEERGTAPVKKQKRWRKLRIFNLFVILLDVAISSSAFQSMGYNLLTSLAIGLGVGIAIYLLSENLPEIIERGKTKAQRWLIGSLIYVGLTIVFYVLGVFRSQGLHGTGNLATSPWYFCCLNLFFYTVASVVALLNKPNKSEKKQLDNWHTLLEEIAELEKKKKELEAKELQLTQAYQKRKEEYDRVFRYAMDLEALVCNLCDDALQSYISANIQNRSDAVIPAFFDEALPHLELHFTRKDV